MGEKIRDIPKEKTQILSIRVNKDLKDRLEMISQDKLYSKVSRVSQNFLNLSEIMIVREDTSKFSWDNSKLVIYPERFVQKIFDLIKQKLNPDENFKIWAEYGDTLGQYLNDVFSIKNIKDNDYITKFKIIKSMGWFNYTRLPLEGDHEYDIIVIPKNFATKAFVYALVNRLVKKTAYPGEWDRFVIEDRYPGDAKDKKDAKKWHENTYIPHVLNRLEIDEVKQRDSNFYYFRSLKIPKNSL